MDILGSETSNEGRQVHGNILSNLIRYVFDARFETLKELIKELVNNYIHISWDTVKILNTNGTHA